LVVINTSCHAYFRLSDNIWRYLEGAKPPQKRKTPEIKNFKEIGFLQNILQSLAWRAVK
jgi:hypothetical protein